MAVQAEGRLAKFGLDLPGQHQPVLLHFHFYLAILLLFIEFKLMQRIVVWPVFPNNLILELLLLTGVNVYVICLRGF